MRIGNGTILVLLALIVVASTPQIPVHAAATLLTSGDPRTPPLYTQRDKQVTLTGSGYTVNQVYYVWTMGPNDNSTRFSGIAFTPVSTDLIPPNVGLPISANSTLGTYLVSVSTSSTVDNSQATAHFGVWGTLEPLYQRTQSVEIVGGGLFPGVSSKLSIRNPTGDYVQTATIVTGVKGDFNYTWRIPEDSVTENYKVIIDGTGTFDNAQQDYVSEATFSVTEAILSAKVVQQPNPTYQRTENAKVSLSFTYPDGSPVVKAKPDIRPVALLQNQSTIDFVPLSLLDTANGVWGADVRILPNTTASSRYRFLLPAMSFDDGYGNLGGSADMFSNYFQVQNASLMITSQVNGTQIQIPFGQVSVISKISYPDGTPLTNGTVRVLVSTGSSTSELSLTYDQNMSAWRGSYSTTLSDLWRAGTWTLKVSAVDPFGNSGSKTYQVAAQPYLFLVLVAAAVAVVILGRWTISHFGRKVYFRIRKIVQRLKSVSTRRLRP